MSANIDKKREEISANFLEFKKLLPLISAEHQGEYALMRKGEIVGYFSTSTDAESAGYLKYEDGIFSVQHVDPSVISFGIFSYA